MAASSRVWELVTNLKDENGEEYITLDKINEVLEQRSVGNKGSIVNYAYIIHNKDVYTAEKILKEMPELKGQHKKDHIHVVMQFSYAQDLDRIAEWFGISQNFFDKGKGRGAWEDKLIYLTHEEDKQQALGKYLYSDDEITADFDFRATVDEYKARQLEMKSKYGKSNLTDKEMLRMDVLKDGMSLKEAMEKKPILFAEDYATLSKLRGFYLQQLTPPTFRLNLYIEGSGGVGKDLMARSIARSLYPDMFDYNDITFEAGANGAEFEGYDGQPIIIWSDVRAGELIRRFGRENVLSGILEPFQGGSKKKQNVKYSSISLINHVNIFTGADSWTDFLNGLVGEYTDKSGKTYKSENKYQSYRRFPLIIPVSQSDFDIMLNEGFMRDNDNWLQYFTYKSVAGSFARAHSLLSGNKDVLDRIESKMCNHVIEAVEEVKNKTSRKALTPEQIEEEFSHYGEAMTGEELKQAEKDLIEFEKQFYAKEEHIKGQISIDDDGVLPF